jgi:hypothetical protein
MPSEFQNPNGKRVFVPFVLGLKFGFDLNFGF